MLGFLIGSALPAAVGSMLVLLQPVIAIGFGVLLLAEKPTTLQLAGLSSCWPACSSPRPRPVGQGSTDAALSTAHRPRHPLHDPDAHPDRRARPRRAQKLRYRLLHTAGRLAFHARQAVLRLPPTWPWAGELAAAFARLAALPALPAR